ncbi:MAG: nucleotidyltransferase domain-containing protein [Anaerolineae bacterium]|nr:nucleotidyltransferase domain-containing protein [Anaerolineae bacterium]
MTGPRGKQRNRIASLSERRERHVAALASDLDHVVQQLSHMPEVQKVILFGSYAAGRRDLLTDLDILVVMDSPLDFVARNVELARRLRAGVALDLLVYTPQEMEQMRDRPFLRHALKTGKVLYERKPSP